MARSLAPALLLLIACTGSVVSPGAPMSGDPGAPGTPGNPSNPTDPTNPNNPTDPTAPNNPVDACAGVALTPSTTPMRQLTPWEYRNAVKALLPRVTVPASLQLEGIDARLTFDNLASAQGMTAGRVDQYLAAAEAIAALAVTDVPALTGCTTNTAACRETWVLGFVQRAFRRPLTAAETTRYRDALTSLTTQLDAAAALEVLISTVLQSPQFLFKPEAGQPAAAVDGRIALDGYELATRLSFFFWGAPPDTELLRAAGAGELSTAAGVRTQAQRLLDDARSRDSVQHFHDAWFSSKRIDTIAPSSTVFPFVQSNDRASYQASYQQWLQHLFWERDVTVTDYFRDDSVYVDARIAALSGLPMPSGSAMGRVTSADRKGVLTQPWFLASFSHPEFTAPVLRGVHVLDRFLCKPVGAPPPGVNNSPPAPTGTTNTTRERYAQHSNDASCQSCHKAIDGIGFGLEGYDATGRHRTMENGVAVDETGRVASGTDVDGDFTGALALADKLSQSRDVERCTVAHWYEYALGAPAKESGRCTSAALAAQLAADDGKLRSWLVSFASSTAFMHRVPGEAP